MPRWLIATREWLQATDPGLSRLHTSASMAVAMASVLGIEHGFAMLLGVTPELNLVAMLVGALVAMLGSMALLAVDGAWARVRTAALFPVAMGAPMVLGAAVGSDTDLMLGVFVIVMFVATFVRRYGAAYSFLGFIGWMGYFFASFMHAKLAMLPFLVAAVVIASAWVLLLSLTVLRVNPARTLQRTVRAFDARARGVIGACAGLLRAPPDIGERQRKRLWQRVHGQQRRVDDCALMVEGWSGEPGALPPGRPAATLRRQLLDAQQALDALVETTRTLTQSQSECRAIAADIARRLTDRNDVRATNAARTAITQIERSRGASADADDARRAAYRFARAAIAFSELARSALQPPRAADAQADDPQADAFTPTVALVMGNLPGSPAVAHGLSARGAHWNPLARMDLTTRQAIQVAVAGGLAILVGRPLSPVRYYWAVIAAFVMFSGTATRSETIIKGLNRVLGTVLGLVVAVVLAELTAGHPAAIIVTIVLSMSIGFYFIRVSYAYMIFFVTIMVAQLYTVFHEFTPGLLVLRLEETGIGAAMGLLVALFVLPLSTRDTARSARAQVFDALAGLLDAAIVDLDRDATDTGPGGRSALEGGESGSRLYALSRGLDDAIRRLTLVARPLTEPRLGGLRFTSARHRMDLYAAIGKAARGMVVELGGLEPAAPVRESLAATCRELATAARLAKSRPHRGDAGVAHQLARAQAALAGIDPAAASLRTARRLIESVRQLLYVLRRLNEAK